MDDGNMSPQPSDLKRKATAAYSLSNDDRDRRPPKVAKLIDPADKHSTMSDVIGRQAVPPLPSEPLQGFQESAFHDFREAGKDTTQFAPPLENKAEKESLALLEPSTGESRGETPGEIDDGGVVRKVFKEAAERVHSTGGSHDTNGAACAADAAPSMCAPEGQTSKGVPDGTREGLGLAGQAVPDLAAKGMDLDNKTASKETQMQRDGALCAHFLKNQCRFGNTCKFSHSAGESVRPDSKHTLGPVNSKGSDRSSMSAAELAAQYGLLNKCVINVPKHWLTPDFKAFVDALGVKYQSLKKQKGAILGFLTFETVAQSDAAAAVLLKQTLRGSHLKISEARPRAWELRAMAQPGGLETVGERVARKGEGGGGAGVRVGGGGIGGAGYDDDIRKDIRDAVTPWWRTEYAKQLEQKEATIGQLLKRLVRKARKAWPQGVPSPAWLRHSKKHTGMACPLLGIVASPVTEGYRNKCEFTIGLGMDGQRTVGFQLGLFREGYTAIASPRECLNVSPVSKAYVEIIQDFIRTSELSVWDKKENKGVWRMVTIREGRAAAEGGPEDGSTKIGEQVLVMIQVSSRDAPSADALQSEYGRLTEAIFSGAAAQSLPLTYLVVQVHEGVSNAAPPDAPQIILVNNRTESGGVSNGTEASTSSDAAHIFEHMCGLKFRLSLSAFFQVNTAAAEKLYRLAGDWAGLNRRTLLFDVCCGTGTIGLTLAGTVGKVVGIEMIAPAVEDARKNAELNGIRNCEFVCGKAEAVLGKLLARYASQVAPADAAADAAARDDVTDGGEVGADVAANGGRQAATTEVAPAEEARGSAIGAADEEIGELINADLAAKGPRSDDVAANGTPGTDTSAAKERATPSVASGPEAPAASLEGVSERRKRGDDVSGASGAAVGASGEDVSGGTGSALRGEDGEEALFSDVVAIVDPPRCGLHPNVLKALAAHERLRRLVYVSCNPESLLTNVLELCVASGGANQGRGKGGARAPPPFRPVKAMAVDLFPHTPHCEMVMLLER
ncbi:hypothetical protein KFL_004920010 [Klebsormidium nitens]|uniref:C3H1-type domain-containing protein n=1 Tax=Klebsormidium nitens TaxID=105231 RepID=A0A1Y1IJ46_KLENI|nr:hypothetical protein KFL_004920010 [Klebsormidium nitens]|eukprot:GAQ89151.1 hypothetical protein KFL_004920010 [Klebsormidium nitens]